MAIKTTIVLTCSKCEEDFEDELPKDQTPEDFAEGEGWVFDSSEPLEDKLICPDCQED